MDLFIQLVLKINTRAERKVDKELNTELKKIRGKEGMLLLWVVGAALSEPSGTVRRVIYPVVGGEKTLKALAAEAAGERGPLGRRSLQCCGRRTRRIGGGCSRRCGARWNASATTPPTGR